MMYFFYLFFCHIVRLTLDLNAGAIQQRLYLLAYHKPCHHFSQAPLLPRLLAPRLHSHARSSLMCVCLVCSVRSHDDPLCTAGTDWSCQAEARSAAATNRHSCGRQCFWFLHYWTEQNGRLVRVIRCPPAKTDGTSSSRLRERRTGADRK